MVTAGSSLIKTAVTFFFQLLYHNVPTSLRKELWVDALEGFLSDDPRGTLRLEATIYSLQLGLGESGGSTKARQRIRSVSRRRLLLVFRVCEVKTNDSFVNRGKKIVECHPYVLQSTHIVTECESLTLVQFICRTKIQATDSSFLMLTHLSPNCMILYLYQCLDFQPNNEEQYYVK